jgi:hypothetical protein
MLCFYNETLKVDVAIPFFLLLLLALFFLDVFTISWHECSDEHHYRIEQRERGKMSIHHVDGNKRRKNKNQMVNISTFTLFN